MKHKSIICKLACFSDNTVLCAIDEKKLVSVDVIEDNIVSGNIKTLFLFVVKQEGIKIEIFCNYVVNIYLSESYSEKKTLLITRTSQWLLSDCW